MDQVAIRSAKEPIDEDHYSILSEMIATVSEDHTQLRMLVYEFARRKLRRNLYRQFEDGDWADIQEQLRALETAIGKVESDCAHKSLTFAPEPPLTYGEVSDGPPGGWLLPRRAVTVSGPSGPIFQQPIASDGDVFVAVARIGQRARANLWWTVQLCLAVLLGAVVFAAMGGRSTLGLLGSSRQEASTRASTAKPDGRDDIYVSEAKRGTAKALRAGIPLPTEYGAFALAEGRLIELAQMAMRVPDQRVAISPVISIPSQAHFAAGKLELVVFRRDLANAGLDRVSLRVVARVARALTFDSHGKPLTTKIDDSWVVRSNSYQMRVAPVADNPEMILIRPDPADLVLPAGRYALVLKGVAYDFTLDGPNTDSAHCLERTDALNSPVYSECQKL
jgi:hypothetical protein